MMVSFPPATTGVLECPYSQWPLRTEMPSRHILACVKRCNLIEERSEKCKEILEEETSSKYPRSEVCDKLSAAVRHLMVEMRR